MLAFRSIRVRMLVPALVAVAAALVTTLLTWWLSSRAEVELRSARARNLPTLNFHADMYAALAQMDALLRYAGESEAYALRMNEPENLYYDMVDRLQKEGPGIMGEGAASATLAALDAYWEEASRDVALRAGVQIRLRAERESNDSREKVEGAPGDKAGAPVRAPPTRSAVDLPAERAAAATRARSIEAKYRALYATFEAATRQAQGGMDAALRSAIATGQTSIIAGAVLLVLASLSGAAFAWVVGGETSRPVRTLSRVALRIAAGDLTQQVKVEGQDEVGALAGSFQQMVERLRELVSALQAAAEEMATAAEQLSGHTRAQSAMLERQASGVAETSSTTRQLEQSASIAASRAASVLHVAHRAGEMSEAGRVAADRSASELHRIQGSVEGIVTQSTELLEQVRQVGDIVETVRDLATQTHVLSLNASIEAVKAGAAGKSFAVVAQEVRDLAEQSGLGAARIGKMVEDILATVRTTRDMTARGSQGMAGSLDQIRASGDSLREIGGIVRETSEAALHIASAVQQQSTGITQIATAMRDLDQGMEETVGRIRALERSAQQVAETARRISSVAAEFRL